MTAFAPLASIASFVLAFAPHAATPQDGKPQEKHDAGAGSDALSYAAFKLETEQRDFKAALAAWTKALDAASTSSDVKLATKAQLGRARCFAALGKKGDADAAVTAVLAKEPENAEAKALRAGLEKGGHSADELAAEAGELLDVFMNAVMANNVDDSIQQVREDVIRMGDAAVPDLARRLRDVHSRVVDNAAEILARIGSERSIAALADGIRDPAVAYPALIANAPKDRIRPELLPIARAAFERSEKDLHALGAQWLIELRSDLPPREAAAVTRLMFGDPDAALRNAGLADCDSSEVVVLLVPTIDALIATNEEERQRAALTFFKNNQRFVPADVAERWTATLGRSRFPSIRRASWNRAIFAVLNRDYRAMERCMLALLGDDDPSVFAEGAGLLGSDCRDSFRETRKDRHEAILAIGRRAIEAPGYDAKDREVVLTNLPSWALEDEEIFDLFGRLADRPAEMSDARRALVREKYARGLMSRHVPTAEARDVYAAAMFRRIRDAAGQKIWLQVAKTSGIGNWADQPFPELTAAAAASSDGEVRITAYPLLLKNSGIMASKLPHLGEDLAGTDVATQLTVLRAIGWGREPSALPAVRKVLENSTGELHKAALDALVRVGGSDVAPDLLAEFRRSPSNFDVSLFRTIESGLGSEVLARAIVDVVTADPNLAGYELSQWVRFDQGGERLSAATVAAVVRTLPKERLTRQVISSAAMLLPPEVIRPIVLELLTSANRDDVLCALWQVSQLRIDAAWTPVVALLDTSDGEVKQHAIGALTKLREYRDLKRTVLADDGDVRREAFGKARALAKSGTAEQRAGSALALAATADVAAIPLLLDLLGDADANVRTAAKLALEKLAERTPSSSPVETPKKDDVKKKSGN